MTAYTCLFVLLTYMPSYSSSADSALITVIMRDSCIHNLESKQPRHMGYLTKDCFHWLRKVVQACMLLEQAGMSISYGICLKMPAGCCTILQSSVVALETILCKPNNRLYNRAVYYGCNLPPN